MPGVPAQREPAGQAVRVEPHHRPLRERRAPGAAEAVRAAGQPLAPPGAGARAVPAAAAQAAGQQRRRDLPGGHREAAGDPAQPAVRGADAERAPARPVLLHVHAAAAAQRPAARHHQVSVHMYFDITTLKTSTKENARHSGQLVGLLRSLLYI